MKQLIGYIKTYYKEEFKWQYGLFILLLAIALLYLNFFFPETKRIHRTERWKDTAILYHLLLYGLSLGISLLGLKLFYPKNELKFLKNPKFWLTLLFGIMIWAFRGSWAYFFNHYLLSGAQRDTVELESYYRIIYALVKTAIALIPLLIFWWFVDRQNQPLYGMSKGQLNLKPYLIILALFIPVIAIASQDAGFLRTYPRSQIIKTLELFNPDHRKYFLSYEAIYVLDFYVIELFFRGFMILALLKFAGPKIILPTAVFYCCLHFGKPFGEAFSSLFGGTVLGIITYYSRSIWGGIIIHMGIAAAMEVCAYFTHLSQQ